MVPSSNSSVGADGVSERRENGLLILSPSGQSVHRRVLFTNCSGGPAAWERWKSGEMPSNRLWGCCELLRMGYEIAIAEPLPDFYLYRNPFPHDLKLLNFARDWLGREGIIYCAHNVHYWLPLLKRLGMLRSHLVSLLYAREPLDFAKAHTGIIALNPAAAEHAQKLAPGSKVANLGWGIDLSFCPELPFKPAFFLSCGRTNRDIPTLARAAAKSKASIRLISHEHAPGVEWSPNVEIFEGGSGWENRLTYHQLLNDFYAGATASLVVVDNDPIEYTACGFTGLIEAMAMGRPAIMTKTGAVPSEIDIDKAGCGIFVAPNSPDALAEAIDVLDNDPTQAEQMGKNGRELAERYYNIERYAQDLHRFFESF